MLDFSFQINFDEWFTSQLIQEITLQGTNFRIIRRRIIWLMGQWTSVKFDRELRPKLYEICLHLLRPEEDMCVRLASCKYVEYFIIYFDSLNPMSMEFFLQSINENTWRF